MDTNALFDVFNDAGGSDSDDSSLDAPPPPSILPISGLDNTAEDAVNGITNKPKRKKKTKNKQSGERNPDLESGSDMDEDNVDDISKRVRREKARPDAIVLDSFEED
ncbi:hypothetical protein GGH13_001997, partial [Coemansia sp. S155-1]